MFMDGLPSLRGGTRHLGVRWVKLERHISGRNQALRCPLGKTREKCHNHNT